MIENLKHILGICGESHINIYTIIIAIVILKLIYERHTGKDFWSSW
jgi:hypothetical protein